MGCLCGLDHNAPLPARFKDPPVISCGPSPSIWSCHVCHAHTPSSEPARHEMGCAYARSISRKAAIVCGSRDMGGPAIYDCIEHDLKRLAISVVIHGDARGVDGTARGVAKILGGIEVEAFPADWKKYGNPAGPIRNREMLRRLLALRDAGNAVCVLAYPGPKSVGTWDMVEVAAKAKVPACVAGVWFGDADAVRAVMTV